MTDTSPDARRSLPRIDDLVDYPELARLAATHARPAILHAGRTAVARARAGDLPQDECASYAASLLPTAGTSLRRVVNATGVLLHTNLGRAPLPALARKALAHAATGYHDVEVDVAANERRPRGGAVRSLLRAFVGGDGTDAFVVNNGAAALVVAALAVADGRPVAISRSELVEIGAGFRIHEMLAAAGVDLIEVGATNRTTTEDFAAAVRRGVSAIVRVHQSNFVHTGHVGVPAVSDVTALGVPVVADIGSGLLRDHALLPREPSVAATIAAGAAVVTFSGDKLLGGPQAGVLYGRADLIERAAALPLVRAFRVDKLTLAALEATLLARETAVTAFLDMDLEDLRRRAQAIVADLGTVDVPARVAAAKASVGGGAAPDLELDSFAVVVQVARAQALREGQPAVLGRIHGDELLLDLRTVAPDEDALLCAAIARGTGRT